MYKTYDKISAIKQIQIFLDKTRQNELFVAPSGVYDEATRNAVIDFQTRKNLNANGIVDKITLDLLYSDYLNSLSRKTDKQLERGFYGKEILMVNQILFSLLNHYQLEHNLRVNNYFSDETEAGLIALSNIYHMDYNGYLSDKLYTMMLLDIKTIS